MIVGMLMLVFMLVVMRMFVFMLMVVAMPVFVVMPVGMIMTAATAALVMVIMLACMAVRLASWIDLNLRLDVPGDLPKFGEQGVGVFGGYPKLLRGIGEYRLLHLRMSIERPLNLRRAVGAVQIFNDIYLFLHGNASLIKCTYEHTLIC